MTQLSVFTLNIWGIGWGFSADRRARVTAIAQHLLDSSYDIVFLQEVWVPADFEYIREKTRQQFPFAHFFDNGIIGSGTCVLSTHLIQDTTFHEFSLNGYPHKISHGDWFAGKGLGVCQISVNNLIVHVFTSHLHAEYSRSRDIYLGHRVMQALEAAQWIKLTSSGADLTVYAGDFNTEPTDVPYSLLRHVGCLKDSWTEFGRAEGTGTCAAPQNSYTTTQEKEECPNGKRIDYILYTAGPNVQARVMDCQLPLPNRIPMSLSPGQPVSYSDHEAVAARFSLSQQPDGRDSGVHYTRQKSANTAQRKESVEAAVHLINKAIAAVAVDQLIYGGLLVLALLVLGSSFTEYFFTDSVWTQLLTFLVRFISSLVAMYSFLMAVIFNRKERNALLGAKATLELIASETKYKSM